MKALANTSLHPTRSGLWPARAGEPKGISQSKAALALLGKAGQAATTRNLATTLKLLALVQR
jgi:hypothetical protein